MSARAVYHPDAFWDTQASYAKIITFEIGRIWSASEVDTDFLKNMNEGLHYCIDKQDEIHCSIINETESLNT